MNAEYCKPFVILSTFSLQTHAPLPRIQTHVYMYMHTQFFIQDTKSSNGTFVNDRRLSRSGEESPPYELKSGDMVQFGVNVEGPSRGEYTHEHSCTHADTHTHSSMHTCIYIRTACSIPIHTRMCFHFHVYITYTCM